jgi:hypothetical protein
MFPQPTTETEWSFPWERIDGRGEPLVVELGRELSPQHILFGVAAIAVARRADCDDVLFATADPLKPLAVVHLTWSSTIESDPFFPATTI